MLSRNKYNFILGLCIFYGFAINYIICRYFSNIFLNLNPIILIIGYFVCCLAGIFISRGSQSPAISFIGYNLIVVPVGALLSIIMIQYRQDPIVLLRAIFITGIVTFAMTLLSCLIPDFFRSLGLVLFISLLILIICEGLVLIFTGSNPLLFEVIGCGIFCGYIGFDFVKAQDLEPTLDNAIDMSVNLYLDIINLFLRILKLTSKKR